MSKWTPCDTPPSNDRPVLLTTCPRSLKGRRTVHKGSRFHTGAWWHHLGARIQDVPVSWQDEGLPDPDEDTEPNLEARMAELDKSCAIMRGEL